MRKSKGRRGLRRLLQGLSLAVFLVLFFLAAAPRDAALRMDFEPTCAWVSTRLLGLIDPLAAPAAFLAGRVLSVLIVVPLAVIALSLVFPRVFCSHVCPLGTLIDLVGALRSKRAGRPLRRLRCLKYGILTALVILAALGFSLAAFVTPLPILTRGQPFMDRG